MNESKRHLGFTLIELLVVIAIVTLIISVLLPSLHGARTQAKSVICLSQLRQMGHAFQLYGHEYNGKCMPQSYSSYEIIGFGPQVFWWGTDNWVGEVDHTQGFLWPYLQQELKDGSLYECPMQPWGSYEPQGNAKQVTSTYGYNGYYLSPNFSPWFSDIGMQPQMTLERIGQPSSLFVFGDCMIESWGKLKNTALLDPPMLFKNNVWIENTHPTNAFRHAGNTQIVAADGHAEALSTDTDKIVFQEFGIGYVGQDNAPHYVPNWNDWNTLWP